MTASWSIGAQPAKILIDSGVNPRRLWSGTSDTPGNDTRQLILTRLLIEGGLKRSSTVAAAGILATLRDISSTHHVIRNLSRPIRCAIATLRLRQHHNIHFLNFLMLYCSHFKLQSVFLPLRYRCRILLLSELPNQQLYPVRDQNCTIVRANKWVSNDDASYQAVD